MDESVIEAAEQIVAQSSPFALRDDHEFKEALPPPPAEKSSPEPPQREKQAIIAMPGTADSPFRHCSCVGVMPGRCCTRCYGSKWTKICPECDGEGRKHVTVHRGAQDRTETCGFCMGVGTVAARLPEVQAAEKASVPQSNFGPKVHLRGAQLPGTRQKRKRRKRQS